MKKPVKRLTSRERYELSLQVEQCMTGWMWHESGLLDIIINDGEALPPGCSDDDADFAFRKEVFLIAAKRNPELLKQLDASIVSKAAQDSDANFLNRLASALKAPNRLKPTKLESFLCVFWAHPYLEYSPDLCVLTPDALTEVCKLALRNDKITVAMVVKTRQRLGLPAFTRYKVQAVRIGTRVTYSYPAFEDSGPVQKVVDWSLRPNFEMLSKHLEFLRLLKQGGQIQK